MSIGRTMKNRFVFSIYLLVTLLPCFGGSSLRILFMLDKFPWYTKGVIVNQIIGLLKRGHDVCIYARTRKVSEIIDDAVYKYDLLNRTFYENLPPDLDSYDLIICQYGDEGKRFVKIKRKLKLRSKLITCIRGGDITNKKKIANHAYDELFKYGHLFLPVCEYFKARLVSLGCRPKKIKILHSAIDCSKFSFRKRVLAPGESVRLLSVNRLFEEITCFAFTHCSVFLDIIPKTFLVTQFQDNNIKLVDGKYRKEFDNIGVVQLPMYSNFIHILSPPFVVFQHFSSKFLMGILINKMEYMGESALSQQFPSFENSITTLSITISTTLSITISTTLATTKCIVILLHKTLRELWSTSFFNTFHHN